jgi:hypothetical protein
MISPTMSPVLPVSLARLVKSSNRPLARRRLFSVRSRTSSVSSRRVECSSSSSATRSERACWREIAEERESRVSSWSAKRKGRWVKKEEGERIAQHTFHHSLLHLQYLRIRSLHLLLVLLHLLQVTRRFPTVLYRNRCVRWSLSDRSKRKTAEGMAQYDPLSTDRMEGKQRTLLPHLPARPPPPARRRSQPTSQSCPCLSPPSVAPLQ